MQTAVVTSALKAQVLRSINRKLAEITTRLARRTDGRRIGTSARNKYRVEIGGLHISLFYLC